MKWANAGTQPDTAAHRNVWADMKPHRPVTIVTKL
jgi:hypothetical protein